MLDDAVKVKVWSPDAVVKAFRAYTFGLRSNTAPKMPAGWELEYTDYTPKFMTLVEKDVCFRYLVDPILVFKTGFPSFHHAVNGRFSIL